MAVTWFIERGGREAGPFTTKQVKAMAQKGGLDRNDQIRNDQMDEYVFAKDIQGLFDDLKNSNKSTNKARSKKLLVEEENTGSWSFSDWTTPFKVFVVISGLVLILIIVGVAASADTDKKLKLGEAKWQAKEFDSAVEIYKKIIDDNIEFIPEDNLPIIFDRVIQTSATKNDRASLEKYAKLAVEKGLVSKTINEYRVKMINANFANQLNNEFKKGFDQIRNEALPISNDPDSLKNLEIPNVLPTEDPFKSK
jgi:hypothetical protein